MAGGNSLINLGDLSKPATVLIEKVSDAVGGIAQPWQIRRVAKAEAEAEKIKAVARLEISDLERRAIERMVREEGKHQENIETITMGAASLLNSDAKPEEIDPDKISYIFERARIVSDEEMQSMWSRILAEEANTRNSFSRTTIDIVSRLEKQDAEIFTEFCKYIWNFHHLEAVYIKSIEDIESSSLIGFNSLMHLEYIGLIKMENLSEYIYKWPNKYFYAEYHGRQVVLQFDGDGPNVINRGNVSLTAAGRQLATIITPSSNHVYFNKILEYWMNNMKNMSISVPTKSKEHWI